MLSRSAKRLVAPQSSSMPDSLCRLQRRKLVRRHRVAGQTQSLSPKTNQVALDPEDNLDETTLTISELPFGQSHRSERFLQTIVKACASNVAVLDEKGNILYVSKPWQLAEQHSPAGHSHPLGLKYLEGRNGLNLCHSNQSSALVEDLQAILEGKIKEFNKDYSCPSVSGTLWFVVHAARLDLPGPGGRFRVLVNSSDITHARQTENALRDLSGRLITAQEEERSRVARELHDNLNQRMALLSVELEQLSQRMPARQSNLRLAINKVCERAQEISAEIHRLSYQLHPSKLDHLGLVAAVKSHCLELEALHEIKFGFSERGCSRSLPKDVTLCLFRIVQESFRNVIKHSGARKASVTLVGTANLIHLTVSDDGKGFDVDSMESKCGLGLVSMKERLRLVGGVLSITSTTQGTKIEGRVPIGGADLQSTKYLYQH